MLRRDKMATMPDCMMLTDPITIKPRFKERQAG